MTEGTKSYLIGCHQFLLHPLWVFFMWRIYFRRLPRWWELICIFLHDVGVCGRQYLSNQNGKEGHWICGAILSGLIVRRLGGEDLGWEAFCLCAGHSPGESGYERSDLFWADKASWLIAPMLWKWWNYFVEFRGIETAKPPIWTEIVRRNLMKSNPLGNHVLFLQSKGEKACK